MNNIDVEQSNGNTKTEKKEIVKLNDKFGYIGTKGLVSGSIEQEVYYCVMVRENGFLRLEQLNAKQWLIKELDDNSQPRLEIIKEKVEPKGFFSTILYAISDDGYVERKRVICVPKGTIIQEYRIDLS